jgi:hypothetical protein
VFTTSISSYKGGQNESPLQKACTKYDKAGGRGEGGIIRVVEYIHAVDTWIGLGTKRQQLR